MRLLHATGGRRGLASCLGGQLLAGSLASGRFAGCLLGAGHDTRCKVGGRDSKRKENFLSFSASDPGRKPSFETVSCIDSNPHNGGTVAITLQSPSELNPSKPLQG